MSRPWVPAAELYGPQWQEFRRWYLSRWWLRKRCFFCRTRGRPGNRIQLNHLTYVRGPRPGWWQVRPLCQRCHGFETDLTQWLRPYLPPRWRGRTHYLVTLGVRWTITSAALLSLLTLYLLLFR